MERIKELIQEHFALKSNSLARASLRSMPWLLPCSVYCLVRPSSEVGPTLLRNQRISPLGERTCPPGAAKAAPRRSGAVFRSGYSPDRHLCHFEFSRVEGRRERGLSVHVVRALM